MYIKYKYVHQSFTQMLYFLQFSTNKCLSKAHGTKVALLVSLKRGIIIFGQKLEISAIVLL